MSDDWREQLDAELDRERQLQLWRLLHSYLVDGVLAQDEDNSKGAQIVLGGMRCRDFIQAVRDGSRVRIRPLREDDGQISVRVEMLTDFGDWQGLTHPPASALGMYPHEAEYALEHWLAQHPLLGEEVEG